MFYFSIFREIVKLKKHDIFAQTFVHFYTRYRIHHLAVCNYCFQSSRTIIFIADSAVILSILYIVVVPVLGLVTVFTCRKFRLTGLENVAAGVLLVLPGMLIDTFVIQFLVAYFLICRKAMLPHLVPG